MDLIKDPALREFVAKCISHDDKQRPSAHRLLKDKLFDECRIKRCLPLDVPESTVSSAPSTTPSVSSLAPSVLEKAASRESNL